MADNDGNMKIIGEFGRRKHKKRVSDCKASATMYRSGSAGGNNGPTVFIMAGERVATGHTPDCLINNGAETGSSVQMTPKDFMADKAWHEMTP